MSCWSIWAICCCFVLLVSVAGAQPLQYRPGQELRTISTETYSLSIQKNGRLDVILSERVELFSNVRPMVWVDGDAEPHELDIQGKRSYRQEVDSVLGQGQGMVLDGDEGQWVLHTYPGKPFVVAQLVYRNSGKAPVRVRSLHPWHVGGDVDGAVNFGEGSADVRVLAPWPDNPLLPTVEAEGSGSWMIAALNPNNGVSAVAGFLAYGGARGAFSLRREGDAGSIYNAFGADYIFEEPIEVAPGENVTSGPLYIAISETNPSVGIERFAVAVARSNEGRVDWLPSASPDTTASILGPTTNETPMLTTSMDPVRDGASASLAFVGAARRYFLTPSLGRPLIPPIAVGESSPLPAMERRSLLTALALLGCAIQVAGEPGEDAEFLKAIEGRISKPARPADLFAERGPRILALPLEAVLSDVTVLGVFNFSGDRPEVTISLPGLGLIPGEYYAVYDIWKDQLMGTVKDSLTVSVDHRSMAVFALRLDPARPALLGLAGSITMGTDHVERVEWNQESRVLEGAILPGESPQALRILVPEQFAAESAEVSGGAVAFKMNGRVLGVDLAPSGNARLWRIRF